MSAPDPTNPKPRRCSTRLQQALWICATVAGLIAVAHQFGVNLSGTRVAIETTDVVPNHESTSSSTNSEMAEYSRLFNSRNSERAAPDGSAATGPLSGTEVPRLKWEQLARGDGLPQEQPSGLIALLGSSSKQVLRAARFPNRDEVSRIEVTRVQHGLLPGAPEPPPIAVITDQPQIEAILNILHKNSDAWEPVPFTPPMGKIDVCLLNDSEFKGVVRLGGHGSLQGPLSADRPGEYFKDISDDDLWELTELLGLNLRRD